VTKVNAEKERVSLRCMKSLASRWGVDAVSQQMASHPQYLESFLRTQHYILHMDGPLPLQYRHYIAIMVRLLDTHRNAYCICANHPLTVAYTCTDPTFMYINIYTDTNSPHPTHAH
jgi:hypothetical protein